MLFSQLWIFFSFYVQPLLFKKQKSKPMPTPHPPKVLVLVTFLQYLFLTIYHKGFCHFKLELLACFYNGIKHNV